MLQVIAAYRCLPQGLGRVRRAGRQLAEALHRRGVSLATDQAALLLASARRRARPRPPRCRHEKAGISRFDRSRAGGLAVFE